MTTWCHQKLLPQHTTLRVHPVCFHHEIGTLEERKHDGTALQARPCQKTTLEAIRSCGMATTIIFYVTGGIDICVHRQYTVHMHRLRSIRRPIHASQHLAMKRRVTTTPTHNVPIRINDVTKAESFRQSHRHLSSRLYTLATIRELSC